MSLDEKIVMLTLLGEAQGEGSNGMKAVALVIQQRVVESKWKRSAARVCRMPSHFSCWNGKSLAQFEREMMEGSTPRTRQTALLIAREVVKKGWTLDRSKIGYANHYCTLKTNPYWAIGKKPVVVIKGHKFFKL
ncbi:MAG: cell wall hydrolase [Patescibacteria group bacterium]